METPQPDTLPTEEPPPHPNEPVHIETPVIDIQDLEHKPGPHTRVSNKGVRIEPHMDTNDRRDLAREDEAAIAALEALEKSFRAEPLG